MTTLRTRLGSAAAALLLLPALAACGSDDEAEAASVASTVATTVPTNGAPGATYPVTVQNCGRDVTFTEAPERIVSGWITGTELLLELGQQDRVVGLYNTSFAGGPSASYAAAYDDLPVLSEAAPTKEALLAAAPDLIYADGNYAFDGTRLPTVDELEAAGTHVLVLSGFCDDGGAAEVLDVEEDLAALGAALGVQEQARELAAEVDARLAAVAPLTTPISVAAIGAAEGVAYAYEGVYSDILERAGATNALAGTLAEGTYFGEVSVEAVTAKDPGTLLYVTTSGETPEQARTYLRKTFPTVAAVREDRVVYLAGEDSSNLRAVAGVEQVARELRSLG